MDTIKIYGASDDLIEIESDNPKLSGESGFYNIDGKIREGLLVISDGTLLKIFYDNDGIWRINLLKMGVAEFTKIEGSVSEDLNDVVILKGDISFVIFAREWEFVK